MRTVLLTILRIPFVAIAIAVVVGALKDPTPIDLIIASACLVFVYGIWGFIGVLGLPPENKQERSLAFLRRLKIISFISAIFLWHWKFTIEPSTHSIITLAWDPPWDYSY